MMPLPPCPGPGNWVPTSHNFSTVIRLYLDFRTSLGAGGVPPGGFQPAFVNWLHTRHGYTHKAAIAYCYPLRTGQFDLFQRSIGDLQSINSGGILGLLIALPVLGSHRYRYNWNIAITCMRDVWLVGEIDRGPGDPPPADQLVTAGYAGTRNAANAILQVGRQVGRHFDLLEGDTDFPTPWFKALFSHFYP
jgi:hypothetical protein